MPQPPEPRDPAENSLGIEATSSAAANFFFAAASAALVIVALHYGQPMLMPLALAALLAFVLDPLVTRLRRIGAPMGVAVALVTIGALVVIGGLGTLAARQAGAMARELPTYQTNIQQKLRAMRPEPGSAGAIAGAARVLELVEKEMDAARGAIEPGARPGARPATRVQVEPAPPSPLRALGDVAAPLLVPLGTAGLVIVLLAYMLGHRREISDRLLRLTGGDLHRMAAALNDAGRRVSRYLVAQLLVNVGYGIPLALGLWFIGVPGALLWGALAAALRFLPYLGPLLAATFPMVLAFAVDPGWSMLLWTAVLIVGLELVVNNIVEPMAYGSTTGVSPVAVLVSAAFWVLVWGPMGLVLATPLTVCLVVLGRHLGPLRFLDVLLGTGPAFDQPTLMYRRLISGDAEEAIALAGDAADSDGLLPFYDRVGVPLLALAAQAAQRADARQRRRVLEGAARIVEELRDDHAGAESTPPRVLCVGARSEFDALSARMLAHALAHRGVPAQSLPATAIGAERLGELSLEGVSTLVLCTFHPQPQTHARFVFKRLRRRWPQLRIVLAAWSAEPDLAEPQALEALGAHAVARTLQEALQTVPALQADAEPAPRDASRSASVASYEPLRSSPAPGAAGAA